MFEGEGHVLVVALAGLVEPYPLMLALEQAEAEEILELFDAVGDRRLGHIEFARRLREAGEATGGLEDHQGIQGRQLAAELVHKSNLSSSLPFSRITWENRALS